MCPNAQPVPFITWSQKKGKIPNPDVQKGGAGWAESWGWVGTGCLCGPSPVGLTVIFMDQLEDAAPSEKGALLTASAFWGAMLCNQVG